MRPAITFLNPKNFQFFVKDFVIPIEVIYPDWDNLSRFGVILSLLTGWEYLQIVINYPHQDD